MRQFAVVDKVTRGTLVDVLIGRQARTGERVVIEASRPEVMLTPELLRRLHAQDALRRGFDHPNVIHRAGQFFSVERRHCWLSEPFRGESLRQRLKSDRRFSLEDLLQFAVSLADAVAYLHARNVVHGSVSPEYIFCDTDRKPVMAKLLDSSLSLLRIPAAQVANPRALVRAEYLAPERVEGRRGTSESDVYSLGAVIFELATQVAPFTHASDDVVRQMHLAEPPPKLPSGYKSLQPIIQRCLAKDPARRFHSAAEVRDELMSLSGALVGTRRRVGAQTTLPPRAVADAPDTLIAPPPLPLQPPPLPQARKPQIQAHTAPPLKVWSAPEEKAPAPASWSGPPNRVAVPVSAPQIAPPPSASLVHSPKKPLEGAAKPELLFVQAPQRAPAPRMSFGDARPSDPPGLRRASPPPPPAEAYEELSPSWSQPAAAPAPRFEFASQDPFAELRHSETIERAFAPQPNVVARRVVTEPVTKPARSLLEARTPVPEKLKELASDDGLPHVAIRYRNRRLALSYARAMGAAITMHVPTMAPAKSGQRVRIHATVDDLSREFVLVGTVVAVLPLVSGKAAGFVVNFEGADKRPAMEMLALCADRPTALGTATCERHLIKRRCAFRSGLSRHKGELRDVSKTGAFIAAKQLKHIEPGAVVQLQLAPRFFGLFGGWVTARVIWRGEKNEEPGFGVRFDSGKVDQAELVKRLLESLGR